MSRSASRFVLAAVVVAAGAFAYVGPDAGGEAAHAGPLGVIDGEALDVSAENLDVDVGGGTAVLSGDVRARLGDLEVRCPKVEIGYDEAPNVKWAKGSGGVIATLKGIRAMAQRVDVEVGSRKIVLTGSVKLARGKGWVTAERATIDMTTQKVSLESVKGSIPVEPPKR